MENENFKGSKIRKQIKDINNRIQFQRTRIETLCTLLSVHVLTFDNLNTELIESYLLELQGRNNIVRILQKQAKTIAIISSV